MLVAALLMALPDAVSAQVVKDKPQVTLEAGTAYIMYTAKASAALDLIREPTEADVAAYNTRRKTAFDKAYKSYVRKVSDWNAQVEAHRKDSAVAIVGTRPVELTEANFSFPPIEFDMIVAMGPLNRFSKADDASVYLQAVPPGNYRVYGPIFVGVDNTVAAGVCMCMGTVQFRAEAGAITNVGTLRFPLLDAIMAAKASGGEKPKTALDLPDGTTSFAIQPAAAGAVDPRIGSFPVRPAVLRASGKMPNWYGIEVDRLTAIPGILSYDRDRIVELASAPAAANH
ncbi:MAG: hypothetical protein JWM65_158 [Sphingomonas bacterium]|nr:hypothetical protein [Sphingomonas bacterium]